MGCCASAPANADGTTELVNTRSKKPEAQRLRIGKDNVQKREQHWKATGIVGLRSNNLKAIPKAVLDLGPIIRTLDASGNRISKLPPSIETFVKLTRLIVQQNQIAALPPEIAQLGQLRVLQIDNNDLSALPEEVGRLAKLEKLTAASNRLTSLPHSIGRLTSLVELDVSKNCLTSLPASIGGCASLQELRAADNELSSLPDELSDAVQLRTLELDANPLTALPAALLSRCAHLRTLSVHGTSIRLDDLEEMDGYAAFEARRQSKYTKQLAANALGSKAGFDQGVD